MDASDPDRFLYAMTALSPECIMGVTSSHAGGVVLPLVSR
jgi:hypothetical protein